MSLLSKDMGIDLGTANTLIYVRGEGIVVREPSVVAFKDKKDKVIAVGSEAKSMIGRTPDNITAIRPIKDGVIADFEATQHMLREFIKKVNSRGLFTKPKIVICVPSGITGVERKAVEEAALNAGAKHVYIVEEPRAAALGSGLPIEEPGGNMIVDIGGGTTEVAVLSLNGIVASKSLRVAGNEFDSAIENYIKRVFGLYIGESTAEAIKIRIGCAMPFEKEKGMSIKGRDVITGLPRKINITSEHVREALVNSLFLIADAIKITLEQTPPELASDIIDKGIVITGGGALLPGIDKYIAGHTGMTVRIDESPMDCVGLGAGKMVDYLRRGGLMVDKV